MRNTPNNVFFVKSPQIFEVQPSTLVRIVLTSKNPIISTKHQGNRTQTRRVATYSNCEIFFFLLKKMVLGD